MRSIVKRLSLSALLLALVPTFLVAQGEQPALEPSIEELYGRLWKEGPGILSLLGLRQADIERAIDAALSDLQTGKISKRDWPFLRGALMHKGVDVLRAAKSATNAIRAVADSWAASVASDPADHVHITLDAPALHDAMAIGFLRELGLERGCSRPPSHICASAIQDTICSGEGSELVLEAICRQHAGCCKPTTAELRGIRTRFVSFATTWPGLRDYAQPPADVMGLAAIIESFPASAAAQGPFFGGADSESVVSGLGRLLRLVMVLMPCQTDSTEPSPDIVAAFVSSQEDFCAIVSLTGTPELVRAAQQASASNWQSLVIALLRLAAEHTGHLPPMQRWRAARRADYLISMLPDASRVQVRRMTGLELLASCSTSYGASGWTDGRRDVAASLRDIQGQFSESIRQMARVHGYENFQLVPIASARFLGCNTLKLGR